MKDALIRRLERVRLTRESLIKMALGIFASFILLSVIFSALGWGQDVVERAKRAMVDRGRHAAEKILVEALRQDPSDEEAWRALAAIEVAYDWILAEVPEFGAASSRRDDSPYLTDEEREQFFEQSPLPIEILRALRDSKNVPRALLHLRPLAETFDANLVGGEIALEGGEYSTALPYFEKARELEPRNSRAVTGWLRALDGLDRDEELAQAIADPEIRPLIQPRYLFDYHRERKEYLKGFIPLLRSEYEGWGLGLWLAVLTIGLTWWLLAFHLGNGWHWARSIQWLCPAALFLGWISTDLTLGTVVIVNDWLGPEAGRGLLYYIADSFLIGLREEFWKLLLFLPLLPILVRRGTEVQALTLASIVGLGFAIQENANYYLQSGGHGILGRYVTANFLHMALTGYAGYFAFRGFRYRTAPEWQGAGIAFVKVVAVHALYDLWILAPQLSDWSFLSMIIFILLSREYLRLALYIRPNQRVLVSMTRIFVGCLATATGIHYLYLAARLGIGEGIWHTFGGLIGVAILCFMYFQEFNERVD